MSLPSKRWEAARRECDRALCFYTAGSPERTAEVEAMKVDAAESLLQKQVDWMLQARTVAEDKARADDAMVSEASGPEVLPALTQQQISIGHTTASWATGTAAGSQSGSPYLSPTAASPTKQWKRFQRPAPMLVLEESETEEGSEGPSPQYSHTVDVGKWSL